MPVPACASVHVNADSRAIQATQLCSHEKRVPHAACAISIEGH